MCIVECNPKITHDIIFSEFRIPKFCELESETASDTGRASQTPHELLLQAQAKAEAKVRAHSRAGSRLDYNVVQQHQANKLGLKNRDYTQVFQAVAPRCLSQLLYIIFNSRYLFKLLFLDQKRKILSWM